MPHFISHRADKSVENDLGTGEGLCISTDKGIVPIIGSIAFPYPGRTTIVVVGCAMTYLRLFFFTIFRHDLYNLSRSGGKFNDGCINNDAVYSFHEKIPFLQLPLDFGKEECVEVLLEKGIAESAQMVK